MRPEIDWLAKRDALRATAEALLPDFGKVFPDKRPTEILLNELLIHKVELEVQIEELRRSNIAMEESRDRYLDLYDRSPIGFLTVSRDGLITELNLVAATLLGIDRTKIAYERFNSYIAQFDINTWNQYFLKIMTDMPVHTQSISISMHKSDSSDFNVHIFCQAITTAEHLPALRLTLINATDLSEASKITILASQIK